jgi:hypothetical protein
MLIVRTEPSLRETRIRHSEEIERPYSNRVRPGTKRVAGISHFVRTHAYFPRVLPRMLQYRDEIAAGGLRIPNEEVLYRLLDESVGLPERRVPLDTHHGIHLRALHVPASLADQRARKDYVFAKSFERHFDAFVEVARSDRCREIVRRLARIDSPPQRAWRYRDAGPGLAIQFRNALLLCNELIEERRQR